RAQHMGFCFAEAEERNNGKAVENPCSENEEICEFFESSCESHKARKYALKNECTAWGEKFGMDAAGDAEENSVARHSVRNTRAAKNRRVQRADSRNDHGQRKPDRGAVAGDVFDDRRRYILRTGNFGKGKYAQAGSTEEQVDDRDDRDSTDKRARKILLRIFHFRADKIQVFPSVVSPQRRRKRREKRGKQAAVH